MTALVGLLALLCRWNYWLRGKNLRPDRMYWADRWLVHLGYYMGEDGWARKGDKP